MIHIVTHCYAGLLPQYAVHLNYQLSSFVLYKPEVPVSVTVCTSFCDTGTKAVLQWFRQHTDIDLRVIELPLGWLFRRSIGRDIASLSTTGLDGLTWFTDVDHVFGMGCLDALWREATITSLDNVSLLWPRRIRIHRQHKIGDGLADDLTIGLKPINDCDFVNMTYSRAIGGIQISPNQFLIEHGYLRNHARYQLPTDGARPFPDFRDDVAFRSYCFEHGQVISLEVPNLFRIRHSKTTYQGQQHVPLDSKVDESTTSS